MAGPGEDLHIDPDAMHALLAGDNDATGRAGGEGNELRFSNISPTSSCEGDWEHERSLYFSPNSGGTPPTTGPRKRESAKKRAVRHHRPQPGVAPICKPPDNVARRLLSSVETHEYQGHAGGSSASQPSPSPSDRASDEAHSDESKHDEKRRKSSPLLGSLVDVGTIQPHPARRHGDSNLSTHSHKRRSAVWEEAIPSAEQLMMLSATSASESEEGMFSEDEDWNDFEVFGARARSVAGGSDLGVSETIGEASLWRHREVRILRSDDAQVSAQEHFVQSFRTVGSSELSDVSKDDEVDTSVQQELRNELERVKAELQAANHEIGNIKEESEMLREERESAKTDAEEARKERGALAQRIQEMQDAEQELRKKLERTENSAAKMRESIFSTELQRDAAIMQFHLDGTSMAKRIEELEAELAHRVEERRPRTLTRIFGRRSVKEEKEHEIDPETGKWLDFGLGSSTVAKNVPKMQEVMEHVDICKNMELVDPEGVVKLQLERMRIRLDEMEADYDALLDERKALQSTISAFTDGTIVMPDAAGATPPIVGGDIRRMSGETPVSRRPSSEKIKMLTWASQSKLQSPEKEGEGSSRAHSSHVDAGGGKRRGNLQIDTSLDEPVSQTRTLKSPVKVSPAITPQEGGKPHRRPPALGEVSSLRDGTVSEGAAGRDAKRAPPAAGSKNERQAGGGLTPSLAFAPITPMGGFRGQIGDKDGGKGGAMSPPKGNTSVAPIAQAQALRDWTNASLGSPSSSSDEHRAASVGDVSMSPHRPRGRRGSLLEAAGRHLSLASAGAHSRDGTVASDKALREQGLGVSAALSVTHDAPLSTDPVASQRRSSIASSASSPQPSAGGLAAPPSVSQRQSSVSPAGPLAPEPRPPGVMGAPLTKAPAASQRRASVSPEAATRHAPPSATKGVVLLRAPAASQRRASMSLSPERLPTEDPVRPPAAELPTARPEAEAGTPKVSLELLSPPANAVPICRAEKHVPGSPTRSAGLATPSPASQPASSSQPKPPVPGRRRHAVEPITANARRDPPASNHSNGSYGSGK